MIVSGEEKQGEARRDYDWERQEDAAKDRRARDTERQGEKEGAENGHWRTRIGGERQ